MVSVVHVALCIDMKTIKMRIVNNTVFTQNKLYTLIKYMEDTVHSAYVLTLNYEVWDCVIFRVFFLSQRIVVSREDGK